MRTGTLFPLLSAALLMLACNLSRELATPPPATTEAPDPSPATRQPEPTMDTPQSSTEASSPTMVPNASAGPDLRGEEAILISAPGPGSRVTSPLRVSGLADPTFEQTLVARIVLDDGTELALQPLTIQADLGQRGPFQVSIPFNVSREQMGLVQVYHRSAQDGGILHLASVGVQLAPAGLVRIEPASAQPESIHIALPGAGDRIVGGLMQVEGVGLASFEGTLVIEVYNEAGDLVGSQPLIVAAPEMGQPGSFSVQVAYRVSTEGPGRIVVVDPLPVFDGIGHIASVEVTLAP